VAIGSMEDVQSRPDERGIALDLVGVTGLRHPIVVLDRDLGKQETVADVTLAVDLGADVKGAHLSRFLEVLEEHAGEVTQHTIPAILADLRRRLGSDRARLEVSFPYFLTRAAPVSGARGTMDYQCRFEAEAGGEGIDFMLTVRVPVTSVCPCSKAISDYGAHNQRGFITMAVRTAKAPDDAGLVWIEELIEVAESCASSPVYPVLKRPDERYVTMAAFDNPVFVEDMARGVAARLQADDRIDWFSVDALNDESIHNHAAFARLNWSRVP
jgi:GTP cyclohydrolase IB